MCISVSKHARETEKKLSRFSKRSRSYTEERQKLKTESSISKYPHLESGNAVAVNSEKGELIIRILPGI
jgi:hypothetical protein